MKLQGCRFLIGDGKDTCVYKDAWLPSDPPRAATPIVDNFNIHVSDLINKNGGYRSWNSEMLDFVLTEDDKILIQGLHLSTKEDADKVVWNLTSHGHYSVKTGYNLAISLHNANNIPIVPPHGNPSMKTQVWKLSIVPKIKHFLWRILSKAIETVKRLNTRGIHMDIKCQRFCIDDESINHLLFTCPISLQTRKLSHLPFLFNFNPSNDLEENLQIFLKI